MAKSSPRTKAAAKKKPVARKPAAKRIAAKPAAQAKAKIRQLTIVQRDRVMATALKILSNEGYEAFTVATVAKKARIDAKMMKLAFPTRQHLLGAVLETNVETNSDDAEREILSEVNFRGDPVGALAQMVRGQMERHKQGGWLRLFVNLDLAKSEPEHADMWRIIESRLSDRAGRIVMEMQRRSYIDAELDPKWVQFFWNALMDGLAVRSRALPDPADMEGIARGIAPILLRGLGPKDD